MTTQEIKAAFAEIEKHEAGLSEGVIFFVRSLKKYHTRFKQLSDRQKYALKEILDNLIPA